MTDESKSLKTPQLNRNGITVWVEEFKGHLMGYKRSHLALEEERPTASEDKKTELEDKPAQLRYYLEDVKEDQERWDERNDIVCCRLIDSVKDPINSEAKQLIFEAIRGKKKAKEICEILVKRFDSTDSRVINAMVKRWTALKGAPGEKATSFITRLKEMQEYLRQKGKTYDNGELVGRLLDGLKGVKQYEMIIAAMETVKNLKFEDAIEQLRTKDEAEMAAEGETQTETAAMAHGAPTARKAHGAPPTPNHQRDDNIECQICKKKGHSAYRCHFREKGKGQGNQYQGSKYQKQKSGGNKKNIKDVECFICHKKGHYARDCRSKARGKEHKSNQGENEPNPKRQRTNGQGDWDSEEFSGMFQENKKE